jgi:hypothetical protein
MEYFTAFLHDKDAKVFQSVRWFQVKRLEVAREVFNFLND